MWELLAAVCQNVARGGIVGARRSIEIAEKVERDLICLKAPVGYFIEENAVLKFISFKNKYQSFVIF